MTVWINIPCRSQEEARAAIGTKVKALGALYVCTGHNDLGVLYWKHTLEGKSYADSYLDACAGLKGDY
jgi:hypothetical protein